MAVWTFQRGQLNDGKLKFLWEIQDENHVGLPKCFFYDSYYYLVSECEIGSNDYRTITLSQVAIVVILIKGIEIGVHPGTGELFSLWREA